MLTEGILNINNLLSYLSLKQYISGIIIQQNYNLSVCVLQSRLIPGFFVLRLPYFV